MKQIIKIGNIFFILLSLNMTLEDCDFFDFLFSGHSNIQKVNLNTNHKIQHSHIDCFENVTLGNNKENRYGFKKTILFLYTSDTSFINSSFFSVWHPPKSV